MASNQLYQLHSAYKNYILPIMSHKDVKAQDAIQFKHIGENEIDWSQWIIPIKQKALFKGGQGCEFVTWKDEIETQQTP